jgi:predicted phage terminase large subunit-like protein
VIKPQSGKQTEFLSSPADIVIYGGSAGGGKTYGLLLDPLRHIKEVKGFGAVIFRRDTPQITNEGGLLDESRDIYLSQGGVVRESPRIDWAFPPFNNKIHFDHLQYEKTCQAYDGAQICYIGFDQLEGFTEYQFFYMLSRNRSTCGIRPCVRATANPDADSWLAKFIDWWIDPQTGYPIEERSGVIRYFVRDGNTIVWGDSSDELTKRFPERQPKNVTFIPANLSDNPILERINPEYRANLQALSYVEQERLLRGNWKIKPQAGTVFKREWFDIVDQVPKPTNIVRFWDMAATRPKRRGHDPDWTAGLKMCRVDRIYYVMDLYRTRDNPGEVATARERIKMQDGPGVKIREEQEPGASGKTVIFLAARDQFRGADYLGVPSSGSKEARAVPASRAAFNHLIKVRFAPWNDIFFAELEAFPDGKHDDIVDVFAGAFNELAKGFRDLANEPTVEQAVAAATEEDNFGFSSNADDELGDLFG